LRECEPPDELRGTPEFMAFYTTLGKDCDLYKRIKDLLEILRGDMLAGDKIEKKKWPRIYIKKYGIRNLFRLDSGKEYRLTYTIIAEGKKKIACVIEFFSSHKKYDQRFGYT
jgi:hypothetical protein